MVGEADAQAAVQAALQRLLVVQCIGGTALELLATLQAAWGVLDASPAIRLLCVVRDIVL